MRRLTAVAAHEAAIVASNLLHGHTKELDCIGTPSGVFTLPPFASDAPAEAAAHSARMDAEVNRLTHRPGPRTVEPRESVGMFETIVDVAAERIVRAHSFGAHAGETINVFALPFVLGIPARGRRQPTSSRWEQRRPARLRSSLMLA